MAYNSQLASATWRHIISRVRLYRSSQAVAVVGKQVYIFGGELMPREPVDNKLDVVNLGSEDEYGVQTLPTPAEAPSPRVGSPSTTIGEDIWIFSGRGGLEMKPIEEDGALWRYKTSKAQWSLIQPSDPSAPIPAGRSYHCIASDGVNSIFVHSGCPEQGRLSDLWEFNVAKTTWTQLAAAPAPARGGASIACSNGKLYRINGFDGKTEQGGFLDVFDIKDGSWSTINYEPNGVDGPEPRSVATLLPAVILGKTYLVTMFGERDPSALGHAGAGKMLADAWAFDIEMAAWQKLQFGDDIPVARGWFDADVAKVEGGSDKIVIHGGLDEENKRLGDVWELTFTS